MKVSRMPVRMSVSRPQRKRQKDQSLELLSRSPSVVDFGGTRSTEGEKTLQTHSKRGTKSSSLVFWLGRQAHSMNN